MCDIWTSLLYCSQKAIRGINKVLPGWLTRDGSLMSIIQDGLAQVTPITQHFVQTGNKQDEPFLVFCGIEAALVEEAKCRWRRGGVADLEMKTL